MPRLVNDGSGAPPRLRVFLNLDNLADLAPGSAFPPDLARDGAALSERLAADGFEGVQLSDQCPPPPGLSLPFCGLDRISTPAEALPVVRRHAERGDLCLTVHAGWGLEEDDEATRLVDAILAASDAARLPVFIETHRATITQDMWRTVNLTRRRPEIRLNGDFSHYYCGQEMPYGGMERKLAFLAPVFERVAFLHGRIASPGCMQMPIDEDLRARPGAATGHADYLADFRDLWTAAMRGFRKSAGAGDQLIFAPELLSGAYYYARLFAAPDGGWREESDRYRQALLLAKLARECWSS